MIPSGREFFKMSGSGNDFVMIDAREDAPGILAQPDTAKRVCARATGVGADGIVFLERAKSAAVRLTYLNADGSRAELCGNATLCTARLAVELGMAQSGSFSIETDSGLVWARVTDGVPEIDLPAVSDVRMTAEGIALGPGERRIGYALVGVPHLVIWCDDVATVDVVGRGRPLRSHPTMPKGANVNFVSASFGGAWRMRTYERGVEAETLACGSGSVAAAIMLSIWADIAALGTDHRVELVTSSGRSLWVRLEQRAQQWLPKLSGEGRIVFRGVFSEL